MNTFEQKENKIAPPKMIIYKECLVTRSKAIYQVEQHYLYQVVTCASLTSLIDAHLYQVKIILG